MFQDPVVFLVCIPAVLLYGIAKGGFGGSIAILGVPLMALVMPVAQAAAILLPILLVMDAFAVRSYWGVFEIRALKILLPSALLGLLAGFLLFDRMNEQVVILITGVMSLLFGLQTLLSFKPKSKQAHNTIVGSVFGTIAGFTSFSIHAGGPPFTMYMLPKQLPPQLYAGTACLFFAIVNLVKVVPYYFLGQFDSDNLLFSLALVPLAPLGVKVGHYLVKKTDPVIYYKIISFFLVLLGLKFISDGISGLLA